MFFLERPPSSNGFTVSTHIKQSFVTVLNASPLRFQMVAVPSAPGETPSEIGKSEKTQQNEWKMYQSYLQKGDLKKPCRNFVGWT